MKYHQLIAAQRQHGIGVALIVAELHFKYLRCKKFNNRADLPSLQAVRRQIFS